MNRVSEILGDKGRDVLAIDAGATVLEAVRQMIDANVGSLLVKQDDDVVGIVSERDYLRRVARDGPTGDDVSVGEIMSSPLIVVSPETSIDECMALMTDRRIRHLPVVENDALVGIISIGDVVRAVVDSQQFVIKSLENYIMS